jgi:hypothetical protein
MNDRLAAKVKVIYSRYHANEISADYAMNLLELVIAESNSDYPVCPSCSGYIPNNETPGAYSGAISRKDNKTEICSACGTKEAWDDYYATGEIR